METMFQLMVAQIFGRINPKSERGATAVEYGLLVAGIAAVIVAVVFTLGGKINTAFGVINSKLT